MVDGDPQPSTDDRLPSGNRVLLRHVPSRRLHDQLELVGAKQRVVAQLEGEARELLELLEQILLVLEHVHRNLGVQLYDQMVAPSLDSHAANGALHPAHDRLRRKDAPGSMTRRTRLRHVLEMALPHALSCHLDETEIAHRERLGPRTVSAKMRANLLQHLVAIRLCLHVDEVTDDDAPDVPETKLSGDLACGFEIRF